MFIFILLFAAVCCNAAPENQAKPKDPVLAKYKGRSIKLSDLIEIIRAISGGRDLRSFSEQEMAQLIQMALQISLVGEIVYEEAVSKGFTNRADIASKISKAKDQATRSVVNSEYMNEMTKNVSDQELRTKFNEFIAKDKSNEHELHIIVIQGKDVANAIANSLKAGGNFAAVAKEKSSYRKENGGYVGFVKDMQLDNMVGKAIADKIRVLPIGKVEMYHLSESNYIIVKVTAKRKAIWKFEEVKGQLAMEIVSGKIGRKIEKMMKEKQIVLLDGNGNEIALPADNNKKAS